MVNILVIVNVELNMTREGNDSKFQTNVLLPSYNDRFITSRQFVFEPCKWVCWRIKGLISTKRDIANACFNVAVLVVAFSDSKIIIKYPLSKLFY